MRLIVWFVLAWISSPLHADLFAGDEPIAIALATDWSQLTRSREAEPEVFPATLEVAGQTFEVKLRARGKSRRIEYCRFPPLMLDLPKRSMAGSVFDGQNKLKLVTHCTRLGSQSQRFEDVLRAERLLYEIFGLLTERSFRTRELSVSYRLPNGSVEVHPAFAIEHKRALAERLDGSVIEQPRLKLAALDAEQSALVTLFAFFAGNVDYSIWVSRAKGTCCHNVLPLQVGDATLPVPYDFDSTGFVDPPYAETPDNLPIRDLKQRLFRGFCRHEASLASAVERFLEVRPKIYQLIEDEPELGAGKRKKLAAFVERFYRVLDEPRRFKREITDRCR